MPYRLRSILVELHLIDYLANTPYNRFIDFVLKQGDLTFEIIYITLISSLISLGFYLQIPPIYVQTQLNVPGVVSFWATGLSCLTSTTGAYSRTLCDPNFATYTSSRKARLGQ
ncbi:MAG: hypothetical protein ACI9RO_000385 [Alteromonas macleodii]|jgi:hypothetical protein